MGFPALSAAAFSFNFSKHLTCGEGGAFLTSNHEIYCTAKAIRHAGLRLNELEQYQAYEVGSKFLMTEFQAAVLLPQAIRWLKIGAFREKQAEAACEFLKSLPG